MGALSMTAFLCLTVKKWGGTPIPIKIPNGLLATQTLAGKNIFVKEETRTVTQDIRPLQILVLNPDADEDRNEDIRLFRVSHLLGRTGGTLLS